MIWPDRADQPQQGSVAQAAALTRHVERVRYRCPNAGVNVVSGPGADSARGRYVTDQEVRPCPNHPVEARILRANRQMQRIRPARPRPAGATPPGTARPAPSRPSNRPCPRTRLPAPNHPARRRRVRCRRRPPTSPDTSRGHHPSTSRAISRAHRRVTSRDHHPGTSRDHRRGIRVRHPATSRDHRRGTRVRHPATSKARRPATSKARRPATSRDPRRVTSRDRRRPDTHSPDTHPPAPTGHPEVSPVTRVRPAPIRHSPVPDRVSTSRR